MKKKIRELPKRAVVGRFLMLSMAPVINKVKGIVVKPVFLFKFNMMDSSFKVINY
jgi:hypothetical protein